MRKDIIWPTGDIASRRFTCGHCGSHVASQKGWQGAIKNSTYIPSWIYICHECTRPVFIDVELGQVPGAIYGNSVADVPEASVDLLYNEARRCMAVSAYTAVVLCCRKLLMHIAVSKGAAAGDSFVAYVEFLASSNYIPPDARGWVDHIRQKSNEANHEIVVMTADDAGELLSFSEMLLKVIFEFPASIQRRSMRPIT